MKFELLFKEGKINHLHLKNRIVMTAMGNGLADSSGDVSEDMLSYYRRRAQGGVGMIITEYCQIDPVWGVASPRQMALYKPQHIAAIEKLATTLHRFDTALLIQLHHPGAQTRSSLQPSKEIVAPSAFTCPVIGEEARILTQEEIANLIKKFIVSAVMAQKAGVDGVEIHAAHGYLLNQFLSPKANTRDDQYGGSTANRCLIVKQIIQQIRATCGEHFVISVRMPAHEYVEGGIDLDEGVRIAEELNKLPIDLLNVTCGTYASMHTFMEPYFFSEGWRSDMITAIKKKVSIPVLAVNTIKHAAFAEQLLKEEICDYVGLGRALVADPDFVNKAKEGTDHTIRPCIGCLYCLKEYTEGRRLKCAVNPEAGRENEFALSPAPGEGERVLVVGGGPSGLTAAAHLAKRGFLVDLWEKTGRLGGMLNDANKVPGKALIAELRDYLIGEAEDAKVNIKLNREADPSTIPTDIYKAVIVASGGSSIVPAILSPENNPKTYLWHEILSGEIQLQQSNIAIIGGGMTGLEVAEYLTTNYEGNTVSVLEMAGTFTPNISPVVRLGLIGKLKKAGVALCSGHKVLSIQDNELVCMTGEGEKRVPFDAVILALGIASLAVKNEQYKSLENTDVYIIGDAKAGRLIADGIREGFEKAFDLNVKKIN